MATRAGVRWPGEDRLAQLSGPHNPGLNMARLDRHAVLGALWANLRDRGLVSALSHHDYLKRAIGGLSLNHWCWSERELDEGLRILGKQLRRALDKTDQEDA